MSIKIENLENDKVVLTVHVSSEKLEQGLSYAYNKNKGFFVVPGFRKGKAPRYVVEKTYGVDVLYEDAINHILDDVYDQAISESDIDVISYPPESEVKEIDSKTGAIISFTVDVAPEVVLGKYKDFEIPKKLKEVTDDDVNEELMSVCEKNVRLVSVTDRAAKSGDVVAINFQGFIDGEPFEGGKGDDYDLELGSNSFIDNFEDQLIGHEVGDDIDVFVTFPKDYNHDHIAGKQATFKVEILDIKEKQYPTIDDEFAQDVSEFDTLDEYKKSIFDNISIERSKNAELQKEQEVIDLIIENAQIGVSDVMIEKEQENIIHSVERSFLSRGIPLNYYLKINNIDYNEFINDYREVAIKNVSSKLVLYKIAQTEGLVVVEEDFRDYIKNITNASGTDFDEIYSEMPVREIRYLKKEFLIDQALKFVLDSVVEV